jgi:hypothetical protein
VRTIFAALVLVVGALAQGPPRDPGTPVAAPSGSGGIRGRVVAADTGAPIRGALVTIATRGMLLTIYTDARGRYEFRDLAPGSYSLRAEPNQHQGQFFSPNLPPAPAAVPPPRVAVFDGQISEAEDLQLPRAGAIVGRVVDERGDPISNVQVTALRPDDRSGSAGYYPSQASDDLGRYRIFHLPPGEYVIVVRTSGGIGPIVQGQSLGFIETYHPGTQSRDEAARVRVRAGEETAAGDLQLTPHGWCRSAAWSSIHTARRHLRGPRFRSTATAVARGELLTGKAASPFSRSSRDDTG